MGIITKGIPSQKALDLTDQYGLIDFVESGTHVGDSTLWAKDWFRTVYTIESEYHYYNIAYSKLNHYDNVKLSLAKSEDALNMIVPQLTEPVLFWLDAHWSRDLHGDKPEVICPVIWELDIIRTYCTPFHVIMIDDARLFTGKNGWPSHQNLIDMLYKGYDIWVEDDVIFAVLLDE